MKKVVIGVLIIVIIVGVLLVVGQCGWVRVEIGEYGSIRLPKDWVVEVEDGVISVYDGEMNIQMIQLANWNKGEELYGYLNGEVIDVSNLELQNTGTINYENSATFGYCDCIIDGTEKQIPFIKLFNANSNKMIFLVMDESLEDRVLKRIAKSYDGYNGVMT